MPTGTGKTITFLSAAKQINKRCLILVHREELLNQTYEKALSCGFEENQIAIISAETKQNMNVLNIAMIQSLARNLNKYTADDIEMMVVDEAHHSTADSYRKIFDHFQIFEKKKILLGFTATPLRGDKACLSSIYESHSFKMTLSEATQNGYICPVHGMRVIIDKELESIETTAGDYKIEDLDRVMNCDSINQIVAERCHHLEKVPALVFCTSVDHAQKIADLLKEKNRSAECVSYKTSKQDLKNILDGLKSGKIEFITNAVKLSEGFDYPPIQSIISVRPTRSPVLYKQIIGRGLRKSENKYDCFVLEFCGNDPKMMNWEDIDNNSTFQSFTDSQKKSRKEAFTFYNNFFGNPHVKILDVRTSPFQFYECKIRRFCKYKKDYRYIPFDKGFIVGEIRPDGGPKGLSGKDIYGYLCLWKSPFKTFYVWDGGGLVGRDMGKQNQSLKRSSLGYALEVHQVEHNLRIYADYQPDPLGKWYPSEEEPITYKQKSFFHHPLKLSARKAEMHLEDCAIKQAIQKYWIDQKMPNVDADEVESGKITIKIYELSGVY